MTTLPSPPPSDSNRSVPDGRSSPSIAPRDNGWPLRPRLSALLLGGLVLAVIVLVLLHRGESTVAGRISALVGLPVPKTEPPPALSLLTYMDADDGWVAIDLNPSSQTDASKAAIERARTTIATNRIPAAEYQIKAEPPVKSGLWAPTRTHLTIDVIRSIPSGAPDVLTPDDANASLDRVSEDLATRRQWKIFQPAILEADGSTETTIRSVDRPEKRGYLHNAAVAALLLAFFASLTRTKNIVHDGYDTFADGMTRFGGAAILGLAWTAAPAVLGIALLYFLGDVAKFLLINPTLGWFGYVCVFIVSAGVGFLPTYGQSFLGGWVFGFATGFPGAMLGFVGGSVIGYFIAQRVSKDQITAAFESNPKALKIRNALIGRGYWKTVGIVTLIRIPPNSPFALTNLVLASSGVKLLPYIIGTAIGMAPRTAIAVWLAAKGRAMGARDIQDLVENQPWWAVPAGLAMFVLMLGILGLIGNRALHEVTKDRDNPVS